MIHFTFGVNSLLIAGVLAFGLLVNGCSKKQEAVKTPPPTADTSVTQTTETASATAPVAPAPAAVNAGLNTVQASVKAGDYDNAAANLLTMQQQARYMTAQ